MTTTDTIAKKVKIGNYVVSGKIGQGGIAEIYKGRQESLGRDVAIKILFTKLTDNEEIVRRFQRESMVIAKLNHPNIVHVIDKGIAGGRYYFVMEYVDGTSMREVMDSESVSIKTKLEMIAQSCKGLDYAHRNGVIHRDIKPANILVDRGGNPQVADFGIAQIIGTSEKDMTSSDIIMGTLAYMSPEQKVSSTNIDQTTDIYAIGVILYEILANCKPLGKFKMPSEINSQHAPFDDIISKCLAQEPQDRYQTAVELKDAILEAIGGVNSKGEDIEMSGADSFAGKCRYLDTIKETKFSSTILVENKVNKRLYVIKKHGKGDAGRKAAKLLSTLKHKNIINILGSGGDAKSTVIISEYAQGGSLADRMVRKYDWIKAIGIIKDVATGLDFAHRNNIVHGNLRPSNILFDSREVPRLTDFGMPVHYNATARKNWYGAPERKRSQQADIYALGVVFHQMVTGRMPAYDAGNNLRLDDVEDQLPSEVRKMLSTLLSIRVSNRYQSCNEFVLDWEEFQHSQQEVIEPIELARPPKERQRKQVPAWVLAVVTGVLVLVILFLLYSNGAFG